MCDEYKPTLGLLGRIAKLESENKRLRAALDELLADYTPNPRYAQQSTRSRHCYEVQRPLGEAGRHN
jgi:hypothetical protein